MDTPNPIYQHPVELLQNLIRFDTTNPPGNEGPCIAYINNVLTGAGISTSLLADPATPDRPNLVARLPGKGAAPPLLMYGHVDVVTTQSQTWRQPPFAGNLVDGCIWGRGALDMKGGVAMMLAACLRAKAEGLVPAGDIILAVVCDEEALGDHGARHLVESHADLFSGVRYAIGEFGGFTFYMGKQRFYPIQIAEKQACWTRLTVRGQGGHGSAPVRGGAMAKLAGVLHRLDTQRLPVHITPSARQMIEAIGAASPLAVRSMLKLLLVPAFTDHILDILGDKVGLFNPMLHNTVSPTVVQASTRTNVIPSQITLDLDCRVLPGYHPDDLLAELRAVVGKDAELEVRHYDPGPAEPDMGLFATLAGILRESDPAGIPIPLLLNATTDARLFSLIGVQSYGFTPMKLPPDLNILHMAHGADERIPADAVVFGAEAIYKLLQRFGASA